MRISDQQILKAVRCGLKRLAADPGNARLLSAIDIAVAELVSRCDGTRLDSLRNSCIEAKRIALRGATLMGKIGSDEFSSRLQALQEPSATNLAALEAMYAAARLVLVDVTLALNAASSERRGDAAWRGNVAAVFLDVATHDAQRAAANLAAAAIEQEVRPAASSTEGLRAYFARHAGTPALPGPFECVGATLLSDAFSRQTILARVRDAQGKERPLIIRKQAPGGVLDGACNTLAEELPFLKLGHAHGLPVPELFWHEIETSILDGDFFVTECMEGSTIDTSSLTAEGVGEAFFRQLAQMMATLHRIDWTPFAAGMRAGSRIPSGAEASAAEAALAMVKQFDDYMRRAELEPLPTMELLSDWLKRNIPPDAQRAVLCHGDIGLHKLLVKDGRITALLGWEKSRLADPSLDLACVRPIATQYVDWSGFMSWYRAAGGPEVGQASLDYYAVFAAFARLIVCEVAMGHGFPTSACPDLEYLRLGLPIKARLFNELLDAGAAVWSGAAKS